MEKRSSIRSKRGNYLTVGILSVVLAAVALGITLPDRAANSNVFPAVIALPDGFRPEGIATGNGKTFFAGSIPTGAIYRGDLRTGEGSILIPGQDGRAATGMKFDKRTGYLHVAGANTGQAYVYDTETGETVAIYTFDSSGSSFINDVIVTREAAYFTNSFLPEYYIVPISAEGEPADPSEVITMTYTGDYEHTPGSFNTNGIVATSNDDWLIVVHSTDGVLYRVDPDNGDARLIDLGGDSVMNGDGILLSGKTLYVVQNQSNKISVIELSADFLSGEIVRTITDGDFDVPTTIGLFGNYLYAVNARFSTTPEPDTEYWIARVRK